MSSDKAKQAAESHYSTILSIATRGIMPSGFTWAERREARVVIEQAFLAGRAHFIEHELKGLLEAAREGDTILWEHSIDELIEKARKR